MLTMDHRSRQEGPQSGGLCAWRRLRAPPGESPLLRLTACADGLPRSQYFSSRSLININWANVTNSYDSFITKRAGPPAAQGGNRAAGLVGWFVDFVSADVQSRATFVAGMLLGFRLG